MKKRVVSVLLAGMMVLSCVPMTVFAEESAVTTEDEASLVKNQLKEDHKGYAGNNFTSLGDFNPVFNPENITNTNKDDPNADFSFWHFVDSSKEAHYAKITFEKGDETTETYTVETAANKSENFGQHYVVITPSDWKLVDGCSYSDVAGEFNLSHSGRHQAELGRVTVKAAAKAYYTETTPYENYERDVDEYYERTVDKYYERTVDEYYERNVDEYYERTVDEYYQRPVTEIYQRYAQRYLIPVFEKKLAGAYNDTMVTRLDYSSNKADAKPTNGDAFKNGHTYVAVNVADASSEDGVWYTIADSSKNNGKKTPDQYNKPVDYKYNVKIADGKLTVSCDDRLAYAGVGAFVYAAAPKDAKNAPAHFAGSVTVDLPKDCGNTVYLYTHFEKLGWYEVDENDEFVYQFKEWKYDDARTEYGNYELIDTVFGDYAYVETKYGEYELVNTVNGEYELEDTVYGDYELVNTVEGEYELVDTRYGDYELVDSGETTVEVPTAYTGTLLLTVDGKDANLNEELELTRGQHTFVLSSSDNAFTPVTIIKDITSGDNDAVDFGTIKCHIADMDKTLDPVVSEVDREATAHYADKAATDHYADKEAEKHYADREATEHHADKEAEKHYEDAEAEEQYNEEYIYNEDIKLGNETDAYGEYAERLN